MASRSPSLPAQEFWARRDFACPTCRHREETFLPYGTIPTCPTCVTPLEWVPQIGRMDALEPFQEFTTYVGEKPVVVDSLRKLRQIERDTEQMARNGEGQQMIWRDYSQDRSNSDAHTLARRMDRPLDWDGAEPDPSKFHTGTADLPTEARPAIIEEP